jgi:hypothetical protein
MLLSSVLPKVCLPVFKANRARFPEIVWNNSDGLEKVDINKHAYFIPFKDDSANATLAESKVFYAERYGGEGLGANGGGVRCGLDGAFQIKGIGRNLLAGHSTDFFHSYGGASLNEGIVESIWGEILHSALPHQAVRIHGLIGTGTRVPLLIPKEGCDPTTARALIVRQAAIRPAHFMRSVFYKPSDAMQAAPKDAVRTRLAIESLGLALGAIYDPSRRADFDEKINYYLEQMVFRFAAQIACARAKRIMHGSLIASNISLDGRWLDFSTTSAMPDYGQIIISTGAPDFLHEENLLELTIKDLLFYFHKYAPRSLGVKLITHKELWLKFVSFMNMRLQIEFLKLTGIVEGEVLNISPTTRSNLYNLMKLIMVQGNSVKYSILSGAPMPSQTGSFQLNRILSTAVLCLTRESLDKELRHVLSDDSLRQIFIDHYWQFREEYLISFLESKRCSPRTLMILNCLRLNKTIPELFRPNLYEEVENLLLREGSVSDFINEKVEYARSLLAEPTNGEINLSHWFGKTVTVSESDGIFVAGVRTSVSDLLESINPKVLSAQQIKSIIHLSIA